MLTARGGEIDKAVGLEIGANGYVTKPFSPCESGARIRRFQLRPINRAQIIALLGGAASTSVSSAGVYLLRP